MHHRPEAPGLRKDPEAEEKKGQEQEAPQNAPGPAGARARGAALLRAVGHRGLSGMGTIPRMKQGVRMAVPLRSRG